MEMRFLFVFAVSFFVSHSDILAQALEQNLPPKELQFDYKAAWVPDRIVMAFGTESDTERTITWRTGLGASQSHIEWSSDVADIRFYREPLTQKATTAPLVTLENDTTFYHHVTLSNLEKGQQYVYRVGDGLYWSEWFDFYIPADSEGAFEFIYLGDAQNDLLSLWARVIRAARLKSPAAEFMMHAGDLVNHSQNDYEWGEWFRAGGHILATLPQVITLGNHEYIKDEDGHKTDISPYWHAQFDFPENGPTGLENRAYYIDHKNTRIICLDSNDDIKEQKGWLEKRLAENTKQWVVVMFHHPVISAAEGRINEGVLKNWKPLLDQYKVDLVLQGHDHVYGRGNQVDSGMKEWDETSSGTVYVVSVAGRKAYDVSDHPWMQKRAGNLQTYQVISVSDGLLNYKAYTLDGKVFDEFDLLKTDDGKNELIER